MRKILGTSAGFTYVAALMAVMIVGIMLGVVGQSWKMAMQREREEELLFRGMQIRDAIQRWSTPRPGQHPRTPLSDLKHLLRDPRSTGTVRYLRRLYTDPLTGKDWEPIRDPTWGIIGVHSLSGDKPVKQADFPPGYEELEGKTKYSDWQFVVKSTSTGQVATGGVVGATATGSSQTGSTMQSAGK